MYSVKGKISLYDSHSIAMCSFPQCVHPERRKNGRSSKWLALWLAALRKAVGPAQKKPRPEFFGTGLFLCLLNPQAGQFIAAAILMSSSRTVAALYFPAAQ